ncbi:GNAT family N-acetyltransferase [Kordiimonas aquimaris]|uniref:GNAT family N-acetyltransferase n=1 Tax=Kordiimonas aquimaris TaxID=707591 RepID=UPI0021D171E1|nr:GNAT family N-acetyltransferase [Kordiimonas aquimaris]
MTDLSQKNTPVIRPYQTTDRESCLAALDANTPDYFAPQERALFEKFLDDIPGTYLVVEVAKKVVGCGGYIPVPDTNDVHTSWGMVHPDYKGYGLGKGLLEARLDAVRCMGDAKRIRVTTSPATESFFLPYGFTVTRREKDGIVCGIDLVEMWLEL